MTQDEIRKFPQCTYYCPGCKYFNFKDKHCEQPTLITDQEQSIQVAQYQILETAQKNQEYREQQVKQAQIDVLNKVKDIVFDYLGVKNIKEAEALSLLDSTLTYDVVTCGIDELIKEVENDK